MRRGRGLVQDRVRERRRRRQRLARVLDLLGQGPGGRVRQGLDKVTVINHDTDAAGQLTDIRDLIAKDVDAIIINPNDPDALNPAIDEAIEAGITVVAIDAFVTAAGAYNLSNDQVEYAYLGAKALFEQMGKKGDVVYMRGIAGHPADTDRDTGFKKALAEYPDIKVAKEVVTKWDPATAVSQINDIMSSGVAFDGVWTSGVDSSIVDAMKTANHALVPIVGADNAGFVTQLLDEPGLKGAAVTNPSAVAGAGVVLALKLLAGETRRDDHPRHPRALGQHDRRGQGCPDGRPEPEPPQAVAPRAHDQGLDHVQRGRPHRLQGPGRVTRILVRDHLSRGCRRRRHPRAPIDVLE